MPHDQDHPVPQSGSPSPAASALPQPDQAQAGRVKHGDRIVFGFMEGLSYPRSPKEFVFYVAIHRKQFSGWSKAPIASIPAEVWTSDHEQALEHPFIAAMVALAVEDLENKIQAAFDELAS